MKCVKGRKNIDCRFIDRVQKVKKRVNRDLRAVSQACLGWAQQMINCKSALASSFFCVVIYWTNGTDLISPALAHMHIAIYIDE